MSLPNVDRNKELVQKREKGWSMRKLAKHFRLSAPTVHEIYHRDRNKYVRSYQQHST